MRQLEYEGYIIGRFNLGEADIIYSLFSESQGNVRFVGKGIRKSTAKLSGQMQPFCRLKLRLVKAKNLDILVGAQISHHYDLLKTSLEAVATGYRMCEMLARCLAEGQPSKMTYHLFEECLIALEQGNSPDLVNLFFSVRLLHIMGSQPNFEAVVAAPQYYLDYDSGSIIGSRPSSHYGIVPEKVIKLWRLVLTHNIAGLQSINDVEELLSQANSLIEKHYEYHYHVQFRSKGIV